VRNLTDGRVEAIFEGDEDMLKEMIKNCRSGPLFAKVTHIDILWEKATNEFEGFEIRETV